MQIYCLEQRYPRQHSGINSSTIMLRIPLLLSLMPVILSCVSTYTILSGPRTLYYSSALGLYVPTIIIPPSFYWSTWLHDSEANWVWWTTSWTWDTIYLKDTFVLTQWAIDRLTSATLKIAADDYFRVKLNGVMLKDYGSVNYFTAYLTYDISGIVRGASEALYQENVLEVIVTSNGECEGAIYRIEFTFS